MPRPPRVAFENAIYHVTTRGVRRQDVFRDDRDRRRFLRLLALVVRRFEWDLFSFVMMDNHIHLFVRTPKANISKGMQYLLSSYAAWWTVRHAEPGHVFQSRFHSKLVEGAGYFWTVTRYVHLNPVRAGMTVCPEDWQWSSFPGFVDPARRRSWVAYDAVWDAWQGEFGGDDARSAYARFVEDGVRRAPQSPFAGSNGRRVLGGREFTDWIDALEGRAASAQSSESDDRALNDPEAAWGQTPSLAGGGGMLAAMKTEAASLRTILPVTVGTAGHIDHGKTSLVRALAGGRADDVDRLSEERERGLTIDVGYAELTLDDGLEVGVVDVPGHEKFVRNMVAGATGIDVVLLVVAADDGVMPQTREHLQIMSLLGLASGCVALTKSDVVDPEMLDLVRADVQDLVCGTFLESAQILPVSSVSGSGLAELRAELSRLVRSAPPRDAEGLFRMPVLRVFTAPGFGTVVTGIPVSGRIAVGDRIEVQPGRRAGRVRGLQVYHRPAELASAGHRTAINLADVDHRRVRRGDVVCAPDAFDPTSLLDVKLQLLSGLRRPLRHSQEVRVHVGTLEAAGQVLIVGAKQIAPGTTGWAQFKLDRPVVAAPGDRFIIRVPAQLETLGGGVVLGSGEHRRGKGPSRAAEFEERERGLADPRVAVENHARRAWLRGTDRARIGRDVKSRAEETDAHLAALVAAGKVVSLGRDLLAHADAVAAAQTSVLESIRRAHERSPLAAGASKAPIADEVGADPGFVDGVLERLRASGKIEMQGGGRVRLAGYMPRLTEAQTARRAAILAILARDPWQSPRSSELAHEIGALERELEDLLTLLDDEGRIVRLRDGVILTTEVVADAKTKIGAHIVAKGSLTPSDLKELVGASRKFGIPLLEHLDAVGFTRRQGDVRLLR